MFEIDYVSIQSGIGKSNESCDTSLQGCTRSAENPLSFLKCLVCVDGH